MKKWVFIGMQKNAKQCEEFATSLYDTANKQGWKQNLKKCQLQKPTNSNSRWLTASDGRQK